MPKPNRQQPPVETKPQGAPETPAAQSTIEEMPAVQNAAPEPDGASPEPGAGTPPDAQEPPVDAPPAPSDEEPSSDDAPPVNTKKPQLTAAEKGAPGKHLEPILYKFGHLPREIIFVFDEKTEIAILTDGTKVTERMCEEILGDD